MNLKKKVISLGFILLMIASGSVYSQGFFKNNSTSEESTKTNSGVLRDLPNVPPPNDNGPGNNGTTPVGEGFAILSLLSGGYFLLKKRNLKKQDEA